MKILINNSSKDPIYKQIYDQIKSSILRNEIPEDYLLPSIRLLAKELKVSNITTKRAYDDLESDGLIYTVVGRGSFVSKIDYEFAARQAEEKIQEYLKQILEISSEYNISDDKLKELYSKLKKEWKYGKHFRSK